MAPRSGRTIPVRMLRRVDFPAPFSPTKLTTAFWGTTKETSSRTVAGPYRLVRPSAVNEFGEAGTLVPNMSRMAKAFIALSDRSYGRGGVRARGGGPDPRPRLAWGLEG